MTADPRRWHALAVLALVQFMIVTDNTIANVALPPIHNDLDFSTGGVAWVINGYLLTAGGLVWLTPRLIARDGRRDPDAPDRLDLPGATLVTFGASAIAYGLLASVQEGWAEASVVGAIALGIAALIAFVVVESRTQAPLVPLRFFANRARITGSRLPTGI